MLKNWPCVICCPSGGVGKYDHRVDNHWLVENIWNNWIFVQIGNLWMIITIQKCFKFHLMVTLHFESSWDSGTPLYCHYSQVHFNSNISRLNRCWRIIFNRNIWWHTAEIFFYQEYLEAVIVYQRLLLVCQWSRRLGFNPRSRHTKDFKNDTWYLLA